MKKEFVYLGILAVLMLALPAVAGPYWLSVATLILYFAYTGQAWNVMMGFAGQLSLGHSLYVGVGAYAAGAIFFHYGIGPWAGLWVAMLLCVALGLVIGFLAFRFGISGVYFALLTIAFATVGWRSVLFAYALPYYIAAMVGVGLFYVQHQFEDAYWESHDKWDYVTACLRGSSHLKLPAVFQWFTGSIGLHHIHHLSPRIPNYRLQRCHDDNVLFQSAPEVTFRSGMSALRLALWDEDRRRMVRFDEVSEPTA